MFDTTSRVKPKNHFTFITSRVLLRSFENISSTLECWLKVTPICAKEQFHQNIYFSEPSKSFPPWFQYLPQELAKVNAWKTIIWSRHKKKHEPCHDKTNKMTVHPTETQISLSICPGWSESSLTAWRKLGSLATTKADLAGLCCSHAAKAGFLMMWLKCW